MKILKYQIPLKEDGDYAGVFEIRMPMYARILHAGVQDGIITLWAAIDMDLSPTAHRIQIIGTGQDVPENLLSKYIGTVQQGGGTFVWHIFDLN